MPPPLSTRPPLDRFPYPRHPDSRPYSPGLPPGLYVFVQAADGVVWVLPETEGHLHPKVLGGATPAAAAGGLRVDAAGVIVELDNYSGTFQLGPDTFSEVRAALMRQGGTVAPDAEHPFDYQ